MNTKRLSLNLISNIIQFIVSLIISFFFTPYFVSKVGETAYGFYAISCNCISYFTVVTSALNSMASRYITIEYHRGNINKVKQYYSTVFYSNLLISVLLSLLVFICVMKIDVLMNVPAELLFSVQVLFFLVLFAGLVNTACSVFSSTVFCLDRQDIKAVAMIFISVIKVLIIVLLLALFDADIIFLGVSYFVSTILECLLYIVTTIKLMPEINLRKKDFRFKLVKELVGNGIWNSINQVNTILINGLDLIIANIMISASLTGILSISKTIPNQMTTFILMLSNIFLPALTIAYANEDREKLLNAFKRSFDILGFCMGILISGFFACGVPFFDLWMPSVDTDILFRLSILGILPLLTTASTQNMGNCALLAAKMRLPVIITFIRSVLGLVLVYYLITSTSFGVYAIAGVSSVFAVIYDLLFSVPYASYCVHLKKSFFYKNKAKFILDVLILTLMFTIIVKNMKPYSWGRLFITIAVCGLLGCIFNFFFFWGKDRRKYIIKKILVKYKEGKR